MKNVLILGSAGFIGQSVASLFLEKGYFVVGIDNLNSFYDPVIKKQRLKVIEGHKNFLFFKEDILNKDFLREIFKKYSFEAVINLAARAGVRDSIKEPESYVQNNQIALLNLLELSSEYKVGQFVQASTSSVYAKEDIPFREDMQADKMFSPYAVTKRAAEMFCYAYHHLYKLNVVVLRYFTVYGPLGRPDMSILRFIKWIDEGKNLYLYGDGSQQRDFTYIQDIAQATFKAALSGLSFETFNIGNNQQYSINELISTVENLLEKKAILNIQEFNPADSEQTCADITKARKMLSWEPQTPFHDGLKLTVDWYKNNREWLKDLKVL